MNIEKVTRNGKFRVLEDSSTRGSSNHIPEVVELSFPFVAVNIDLRPCKVKVA